MGRDLVGDGFEGFGVLATLLQGLALVEAVAIAADACGSGKQQAPNQCGGGVAHRPGPHAA